MPRGALRLRREYRRADNAPIDQVLDGEQLDPDVRERLRFGLFAATRATRPADESAIDRARAMSLEMVAALADHPRVVIVAGPRTGKGSISVRASERYGRPIRYGDALVGKLDWSPASEEVARWLDADGEWIVEGVVTVRAVRKWLASHDGAPPFAIIWLATPIQVQSAGQEAMSKGVRTVWSEILPELRRRGATIIERD